MIELLETVAKWDEIRFVVRNQNAIAELCGKPNLRRGEDYLTIELAGSADHMHLRASALARAELGDGTGRNCFVRFVDSAGEPILTCYVPRTNRAKADFDAARWAAFEALKARYDQTEGVTILAGE